MVKPLILMFWSFVQVFMFCDFGENVTGGFEELNDAILENDWYTFPIGIQRMFPIIMISIQKTVILHGFGNIPCTREAFKKVSFFFSLVEISIPQMEFNQYWWFFKTFFLNGSISGPQWWIFILYGSSKD